MAKNIILWMLGVPISVLILLNIFGFLCAWRTWLRCPRRLAVDTLPLLFIERGMGFVGNRHVCPRQSHFVPDTRGIEGRFDPTAQAALD